MDIKRIELYKLLYGYVLILRKPFADFLYKHMKNVYGDQFWSTCVELNIKESYKKSVDDLDVYDLLNILISQWGELYGSIKANGDFDFVYDENFNMIKDMFHIRNIISHANENNDFVNHIHQHLSILLKFANFIGAYEHIIINLKNDLLRYKQDRKNDDSFKRDKLLDVITSEVLFHAMICNELSGETKASVIRTIITIQNMKTAGEIYDFYAGALQSSRGNWVYKNLKEKGLTTFEDVRDKINAIMNE